MTFKARLLGYQIKINGKSWDAATSLRNPETDEIMSVEWRKAWLRKELEARIEQYFKEEGEGNA